MTLLLRAWVHLLTPVLPLLSSAPPVPLLLMPRSHLCCAASGLCQQHTLFSLEFLLLLCPASAYSFPEPSARSVAVGTHF